MSSHPTDFQGSVLDALREAIESRIPDSQARVTGGGGHFSIEVVSPAFAGKNMLQSQRYWPGLCEAIGRPDTSPTGSSSSRQRLQTPCSCSQPAMAASEA